MDRFVIDGLYLADLCFCSVNAKYKVVLVTINYFWRTRDFCVATCGDESWERIGNVGLKHVYQGPFFKGYRHWLNDERVIYFDPSMNKLIDIATPQPKEGVGKRIISLGVLDGCLCMTRTKDHNHHRCEIELLVMKEYGNGNSWEIMFVFSNIHVNGYVELINPLFRTKKGELLIGLDMERPWYCYNIKAYDDRGNFLKDILNNTDLDFYGVILYEENWSSPTDIKSCD